MYFRIVALSCILYFSIFFNVDSPVIFCFSEFNRPYSSAGKLSDIYRNLERFNKSIFFAKFFFSSSICGIQVSRRHFLCFWASRGKRSTNVKNGGQWIPAQVEVFEGKNLHFPKIKTKKNQLRLTC